MIRPSNLRKMYLMFGILHYPFCVNHSLELTVADNLGIQKFRLYSGDTVPQWSCRKGSLSFPVSLTDISFPSFCLHVKLKARMKMIIRQG
ncbi:hypothetical protein TorRG33x02_179650 [Trema orientale]|uniref:Uncharacterized protein n=1 Tax=Trema orientale TaxID=63057 RepID=A0A2P5EL10_TREOI|nr:hypothetical protein TorRG33x02_179650 [Trema orientale]